MCRHVPHSAWLSEANGLVIAGVGSLQTIQSDCMVSVRERMRRSPGAHFAQAGQRAPGPAADGAVDPSRQGSRGHEKQIALRPLQ